MKELEKFRKLSNEKLIELRKDLKLVLIDNMKKTGTSYMTPKENRGKIRRSIARINTILGERGLRGHDKPKKI